LTGDAIRRARRILASRAALVALLPSLSVGIFRGVKEVRRGAGDAVRIPGTLSRVGELLRAAKRGRVRPISSAKALFREQAAFAGEEGRLSRSRRLLFIERRPGWISCNGLLSLSALMNFFRPPVAQLRILSAKG